MRITAAMAAALAILTEVLDEPGTDIAHSLHRLTLDAAAAVTSYLGLSVVVSHSDSPFTVTALAEGALASDIRTSLHLSLPGPNDPQIAGGGHHSVRGITGSVRRPRRGPGVAHCTLTERVHPRSAPLPRHRAAARGTAARGISDQPSPRGSHRARLHPTASPWELDTQAAHAGTDRHTAAYHILAKINTGDDDQHFGIYWGLSD